jgi:hypothetical protein
LALCTPTTPAIAQNYQRGVYESGLDSPSPDVSIPDRFSRRQFPVGAHIGALSVNSSLQLDQTFDDNIFAATKGVLADSISNLTGRASLNYGKGSNSFDVQSWLVGHIYAVHSTEDAWEGSIRTSYTSTVHKDVQLSANGDVQRLVLPRTDPTGLQGLTPTTYELYNANVAAIIGHYDNSLLELRFGAGRTSYDPLQGAQGPIFVNDRNNTEIFGEANFRHTFAQGRGLYVKARPNIRDYDLKFDQGGFQRSSNGVRLATGVDWDIDSVFLVNLETGFQHQAYDDPRFGTVGEPDGRFILSWWPTRLTNVRLNGVHEYYEAFFTPSAGAIRNKVTASIDHELRRRWIASASFSFERDDLRGTPTRYTTQVADLSLKYLLADGFSAGLEYMYAHQTSTSSATSTSTTSTSTGTGSTTYQRNIITLTLKKLF